MFKAEKLQIFHIFPGSRFFKMHILRHKITKVRSPSFSRIFSLFTSMIKKYEKRALLLSVHALIKYNEWYVKANGLLLSHSVEISQFYSHNFFTNGLGSQRFSLLHRKLI